MTCIYYFNCIDNRGKQTNFVNIESFPERVCMRNKAAVTMNLLRIFIVTANPVN